MKIPRNKNLEIMKDEYDEFDRQSFPMSTALMFEKVAEKKDIIKFAILYCKSDVFKDFFHNPTVFSQSPLYVLQLFKEELSEKGIDYEKDIVPCDFPDTEASYWIGYIISYWYIVFEQNPAELTKDNLLWLYMNYDTLHTQSCDYVYENYFRNRKVRLFLNFINTN